MLAISRRCLVKGAGASTLLLPTSARPLHAESGYPRRSIRVIVPFAAGGGQDEFARRFLPLVGGNIGKSAYIDNRPGGNSILATETAVRSPPDGYTVLQQTNSLSANPALIKQLTYDTLRDLAPVSLVSRTPHVLIVRPNFPARDLASFIEQAKRSRAGLNYGSAGVGSTNHLGALMLSRAAGIKMENVVYRGASEFTNDLLGGQIDMVVAGSAQGAALARTGQAHALAVTAKSRIASLPEVPTFKELGLDVEIYSWTGYLVPAQTPSAIVDILAEKLRENCYNSSTRERFSDYELLGTSPAEFRAFLIDDMHKANELLKGVTVHQ